MQQALQPTQDRDWLLVEQGYDPRRERSVESRFTVSNGFLGVRGSRAISRGPSWVSWLHTLRWASWPRTYVAGLFDTPNTEPPVPALVPVADWLRLRILLNGKRPAATRRRYASPPADPGHAAGFDAHGVAPARSRRDCRQSDNAPPRVAGRSQIWAFNLFAWRWSRATPRSRSTRGSTRSGAGLDPVRLEQDLGVWRTEQSGKSLAMACTASLQLNDAELSPRALDPVQMVLELGSAPGQAASFQRLIAVARSDSLAGDPGPGSTRRARSSEADRLAWRARRT